MSHTYSKNFNLACYNSCFASHLLKGAIKCFLIIFLCLTPILAGAKNYNSTKNGSWNSDATWGENNKIPEKNGDGVTIKAGHEIRIPNGSDITIKSITLENGAKLIIEGTGILKIREDFIISGSSSQVTIEGPGILNILDKDVMLMSSNTLTLNNVTFEIGAGKKFIADGGSTLTIGDLGILKVNTLEQKGTGKLVVKDNGYLKVSGEIKYDVLSNLDLKDNSTIEYNHTDEQKITKSINFKNLTISGNSGVKSKILEEPLTVLGNFTIETGASFDTKNYSITVAGNWTNNGTFNAGTGTVAVTLNGVTQTISGSSPTTFRRLTLSTAGTKTVGQNVTVQNNGLTIPSDVTLTFDGTTRTLNVTGTVTNNGRLSLNTSTLQASGAFTNSGTTNGGSGQMLIAGNWTNNGTFTAGTSTVNLNGAIQTISGMGSSSFHHLTFSGSGTKTPNSGLRVNGNLTINGTANFVGGSHTHVVAGNWTNSTTSGPGFTAGTSSTVELNGATQTINGMGSSSFHHLTFRGSGTKTPNSGLRVNGNLSINGTASFVGGNFTHIVSGNWTNNGTFNAGLSTVELNGGGQQIIGNPTTFYNLSVSGGTTLNTNITVNNNLSLSNGKLNTGANIVTLGPSARLGAETFSSYVYGRITTERTLAATLGQSYQPSILSSGEDFGNIGFSASSNRPVTISVERVTGETLTNGTDESVPRYYDVQPVGVVPSDLQLTASFAFLPEEFDSSKEYVLVREISPNKFTRPTSSTIKPGEFGKYTKADKQNPLPVDLVWFKLAANDYDVLLTWQTAWERENEGFEIQFSQNGKNFRKVGFVKSGTHTRTGAQNYSFLHDNFYQTGIRYYRLAQHDLDGKINYSAIKAIEIVHGNQFIVYPNPFTDELSIVVPTSGESRVTLMDQTGKIVAKFDTVTAKQRLEINPSLPNGVYLLQVFTENSKYVKKLIKQ